MSTVIESLIRGSGPGNDNGKVHGQRDTLENSRRRHEINKVLRTLESREFRNWWRAERRSLHSPDFLSPGPCPTYHTF